MRMVTKFMKLVCPVTEYGRLTGAERRGSGANARDPHDSRIPHQAEAD